MAQFTFRCVQCGTPKVLFSPAGTHPGIPMCDVCGSMCRRDYRADKPQPAPVWQEHFNPSTGTVVSDKKRMQSDLDRAADALYERTGIEQRNVVVERGDMATQQQHLGTP